MAARTSEVHLTEQPLLHAAAQYRAVAQPLTAVHPFAAVLLMAVYRAAVVVVRTAVAHTEVVRMEVALMAAVLAEVVTSADTDKKN